MIRVKQKYLKPFKCVKNELRLVQKSYQQNVFTNHIYLYMYKEDLVLNNLEGLICYKTKPIQSNLQSKKNQKCIDDYFGFKI